MMLDDARNVGQHPAIAFKAFSISTVEKLLAIQN